MITCGKCSCPSRSLRAGLCRKHINTTEWVLTISDKSYLAAQGHQILTYTDVMFYRLAKIWAWILFYYQTFYSSMYFGGLIWCITKTGRVLSVSWVKGKEELGQRNIFSRFDLIGHSKLAYLSNTFQECL